MSLPRSRRRRIAKQLKWRCTPKYGSWLNIAASEFAALAAQCLDRRITSEAVVLVHGLVISVLAALKGLCLLDGEGLDHGTASCNCGWLPLSART